MILLHTVLEGFGSLFFPFHSAVNMEEKKKKWQ